MQDNTQKNMDQQTQSDHQQDASISGQAQGKTFEIGEAINVGWEIVKHNIWFFVGLLLLIWVLNAIPDFLSSLVQKDVPILAFVLDIGGYVLSIILSIGAIKIVLDFLDGKKGDYKDLFSQTSLFVKYLGASLLYGLIVIGGCLLLIVPGVIWALQFQFFGYFIVEQKLGAIDALSKSSEITRGHKGNLFLLWIVFFLVNLAGLFALVIGLFVTIPIVMIATGYVYKKLRDEQQLMKDSQSISSSATPLIASQEKPPLPPKTSSQ